MIQNRLHLSEKGRRTDIILPRELSQKQSRIIEFGMYYRIHQSLEKECNDSVTGQLHIHDIGGAIDFAP